MTRLFSKCVLVFMVFLYIQIQPSFQANVSPKVDFIEDNQSEHVPPKIQGVRDASKMGGKMEDKTETIRIQTDGAKQTVGTHTDITFEIDDKNKTKTKSTNGKNAESDEDDDTEVPVYRTHTQGDRNNFNRRRDPNEYYMNRPNFHGTNDDEGIKYADAGTWVRFLPMANGAWTTERYSESFTPQNRRFPPDGYRTGYVPYTVGQKSLQRCICDDRNMWREGNQRSFGSSTMRPRHTDDTNVDDKLEYPFSESD